jgi:glycosyltransferase involved in cell wall biosynthesis
MIVGFVGRLDSDRGLHVFVELIKMLKQGNCNFKIIVIGLGHLKDWLNNSLLSIVSDANIRFTRAETSEQMSELWGEITVLASTAPAESFGRSIREALIHGVPVLAISSSGANEVAQLTDSIGFMNLESAGETISNLNRLLLHGVSSETQEKLLALNHGNSKALVKSWETLLIGDTK